MYKERFAKVLKEYIGDRSINQVAKDIGIPTQTLHRYVNCQREIGLEKPCEDCRLFSTRRLTIS
ncbi:MAG: hypothetical protein L6V85_03550 [Clostridiales bacterium]|nr:MAG: hypothetical protein L6V85_03550 [Clostridiales bacterium]